MPAQWPWFERQFTFDFPVGKYPDILERLRGTPLRATGLTAGLVEDVLTRRAEDTWSIQENVGHLADLEPLWTGRIEDILGGQGSMREADLTNSKTFQAAHNERSFSEVLGSVVRARAEFMARLDALTEAEFARSSIHPRTKLRMRIVDLCLFAADHDDYHLARISELRRLFSVPL